ARVTVTAGGRWVDASPSADEVPPTPWVELDVPPLEGSVQLTMPRTRKIGKPAKNVAGEKAFPAPRVPRRGAPR
ncbi:MAG: hypothetical protein U0165_16780, partial [Polyangiaceae bacterium]